MKSCPTASQIERYAAGELSPEEVEQIDRHVEGCLECAQRLDGATAFADVLSDVQQASQQETLVVPESKRIKTVRPEEDSLLGRVIGDFEVRRLIGIGGMGTVYEAEQLSLKRRVALKVLHAPVSARTAGVLRFGREAQAAARLHHTNVVSVFAQGLSDGLRYYAMEMIDGSGLDQVIREIRRQRDEDRASAELASADGRTPARSSRRSARTRWSEFDMRRRLVELDRIDARKRFDLGARLLAEVADALDYAHRQGVIHRDVKPSNLILSADGRMSLTDFGLARVLEQPGMTVAGEFMGSPLYMSPEQVAAGRVPIDHRTDIYSLGASLYEFLCLQPPYAGETRDQVIGQIRRGKLRRLRQIDRRIPKDLETVCLKAMRPDPVHRYESAGEMADDLRRFVQRFAIHARRASAVTRAVKFVRRHSLEVGIITGVLVVMTAIGTAALYYRQLQKQAEIDLISAKNQARESLSRWDRYRLAGALDQGYADVANCQFAKAHASFTNAIQLVENDKMGHLGRHPGGYVGRGLTGYLAEILGVARGRSVFADDFKTAFALRPRSELISLLSRLPDPATASRDGAQSLAPLLAEIGNIGDGPIRDMTRDHGALVYVVLAWVALAGRDLDLALALSDEALAAQPNFVASYLIHAMVLSAKGQLAEARDYATWAMRWASHRRSTDDEQDMTGYVVRAMVMLVMGNRYEAFRQSRLVVNLLSKRPTTRATTRATPQGRRRPASRMSHQP